MAIMIRVFQFFLLLFAIVSFYLSMAFVFSFFPSTVICEKKEHKIYIYHNNQRLSHTEIIMKVSFFKEDFIKAFPSLLHNNVNGYIAFSYGDRDFMMDESGFDELNITLALRGLFVDTPALIKVGHYAAIAKEKCQEVKLSQKCLSHLKESILRSFVQKDGKNVRYHDRYKRYYIYYYQAKNNYNLFHTCNTWTGDRLREAGVSMPYWTPFAENITSNLH